MCAARLTKARVTPYGVTGDELQIKGAQLVRFKINGQTYSHKFIVSSLSTDADAIVGTDFLHKVNAKLDLENQEMWMLKNCEANHDSSERKSGRARGTADRASLTVFSAPNRRDKSNTCLITHTERKEEKCHGNSASSSVILREADPWLVELTETVKVPPRVKKMVVGKVKFQTQCVTPKLVCIEPAQMPFEGVLAARGLSHVLPVEDRSGEVRETSRCGRTNQLKNAERAERVHVMVVNFSEEEITLPKATVVGVAEEVSPSLVAAINDDAFTADSSSDRKRRHVNTVTDEAKFREYLRDVLGHLPKHERAVMEPVLRKYQRVFHMNEDCQFQATDLVEHRIITGDAKPIRKAPYRVPYALRDEMETQVKTMLKKGVIEPSSSPWAAPAILVPKKSTDGRPKYRFCVDFRALNKITQFDNYPLPIFEETVSTLHGSQYFSVIDLYSGFWQIKLADEDKMKTAFTVPGGSYNFLKLPFGLSNSPASFQRLMDVVLRDLIGNELYVFIDDVIVFSNTIEEHAARLEHVLQRFAKANLQLQPGKCVFAQPQVEYLGYIVSRGGISASPDKTKAVRNYPTPVNVKEVRSFLGLASFYRRLVPQFAQIAKPLTELLRKDAQFKWNEPQQSAFVNLKTVLCSDRVLAYPDFREPFIVTTDASKVALAAVLSPVQDGVERPVSFASRQTNKAEQNYSASEAEMCAVLWATKHFRCYLYGKKFVLRTDHSALKYMHTFADNNSRLLRWSLRLAEFDFSVEHRPGTQMRHVDSLSRAIQSVTCGQDLTRDEVKQAQRQDKFCKSLEVGRAKGRSEYFLDDDGLIYRRRRNNEHQLVVPASLVDKVIGLNHDPVTVGHPGRNRTLDILCLRFYWPGMRRKVEAYVQRCHTCQQTKPRHEFKAPMGEVTKPKTPFEVTAMDVCGPFPKTPDGNRYLLTFMDHLTHYPEAIPIKHMTAEECARAYATHIIARHGSGSKLISDQGRNFTSVFFRETCKILGIRQIFTTAYHPQANGKLERFHKTLAEGLSHYVNACGNNWDTLVPLYLMAFRNTPHGTSGYSPYYMLHGCEMILPSLQDLKAKLSPEVRDSEHAPRLENLKANLRSAYKFAREHARKSHDTNKQYYDRRARDRNFSVGDHVYLYTPAIKVGLSAKFRKPWTGPWRITARKSRLNHTLINARGKKVTVHVNRMKFCHEPPVWQEKAHVPKVVRPQRRQEQEEEEQEISSPGPVPRHAPVVENQHPDQRSPEREDRQRLDTPTPGSSQTEPPSNHRMDPTYVPSDTPRTRREMGYHRENPPLTRFRSRLQNLAEVPEDGE